MIIRRTVNDKEGTPLKKWGSCALLQKRWVKKDFKQDWRVFQLQFRDDNSSENFTPRGIEELKNGNLSFLGDCGR